MSVPRNRLPGPAGATLELVACGDSAILVTVTGADPEARWRCVRLLAEGLEAEAPLGVTGTVAAYDTVLAEYDPVQLGLDQLTAWVGRLAGPTATLPGVAPERRVVIPVVYGGEHGPDLEDLAAELELSPEELIRRHTAAPYVIRTVVSPAGAPMTDGPELPRAPARLAVPRVAVPGGSVALAGRQAMVYATPSPGGWRLIGRTPVVLFDPRRDPPVDYRPGDLVEYVAIEADRWSDHAGQRAEVREP